jgi:hypothetical protein
VVLIVGAGPMYSNKSAKVLSQQNLVYIKLGNITTSIDLLSLGMGMLFVLGFVIDNYFDN